MEQSGEHPSPQRSYADAAGATLIVAAIVGVAAWAWALVRTQVGADDPGSFGDRIDLLAAQTPTLLLAGLVAGVGVGLRSLAAAAGPTGAPTRPVFGRPVVPLLLGVTAALVAFLGGAVILGDDDDDTPDLMALYADIDDLVLPAPSTSATTNEPPLPTHTLEVHSDGCGVFRSGDIGDDLTWVIKDDAGFQVLGRNAAGETQYRYFRPGTYTVVLEAWGGAGYDTEVSNEVTINC